MTIPSNTGSFDYFTGSILPDNNGTWADLSASSWSNWRSWLNDPDDTITYLQGPFELPRSSTFNLNIETVANGIVSYKVYTSETGAFAGEETETVIANNATDISAFTGKFVLIAVEVQSTSGVASINSVKVGTNTNTYTVKRSGVDTTTLSGTTDARVILTPAGASYVWAANIQARGSSYTQESYVTDYPTGQSYLPTITNTTTSGVTFKLVGIDNVARDATIDYELVLLAEMNMVNGNLVTE